MDDYAAGYLAARRDVLRVEELDFEAGERQPADEPGDHQRGEHRGQDQEQQIVGGSESGDGDDDDRACEQQARACDLLASAGLEKGSKA